MKKIKYAEFQAGSGKWYVVCPDYVGKQYNAWYAPARLLNMDICDFVLKLKSDFKVDNISFNNDVLLYSWNNKVYAHKFVMWLNKNI